MKALISRFTLSVAGAVALAFVSAPATAAPVSWDIDSAQSYVRLSIPDQKVDLDGTTATIRFRNQSNGAWSPTTGSQANVQGSLLTNFTPGSSIEFLGGQHSMTAIESYEARPNPAAFDPNATNGDNPNGSYTNTSSAPAAYAARVNGSVSFITLDLARLAFRSVSYDLASDDALLLDGSGAFGGSLTHFGIASALLDVDGLSAAIVGQVVPDMANEPLDGLTDINVAGGVVTALDASHLPYKYQLVYTVNVPVAIDLDGTPVNAQVTGQIVAYAVPEPSTIALAGFGIVGLVVAAYRRLNG